MEIEEDQKPQFDPEYSQTEEDSVHNQEKPLPSVLKPSKKKSELFEMVEKILSEDPKEKFAERITQHLKTPLLEEVNEARKRFFEERTR